MPASVIVWDIETVPDLRSFAAANGLIGRLDDEVRAEMGDKFPKLIYHSIVCIGALVAQREDEHWAVSAIGAPNIGERSEKEIISAFVNRIADLTPQLVTFNGAAFDLPVVRYRAMVCGVGALGWRRALTSIAIPKTRLTCATCCRPSAPRTRRRCTNCVASWGFPGSPTTWAGRMSRGTVARDA